MELTKYCAQCGAPYTRNMRSSLSQWHARRFCSRLCSSLSAPPQPTLPAIERLNRQTNKAPGLGPHGNCWEWTGHKDRTGHAKMKDDRHKSAGVHRVAYEAAFGPIPKGAFVCHRCDNGACVRPSHLFLGNQDANMKDMSIKGRAARGEKNFRAKLTETDIRAIRSDDRTNVAVGKQYGVSPHTISKIKWGRLWAHVKQ